MVKIGQDPRQNERDGGELRKGQGRSQLIVGGDEQDARARAAAVGTAGPRPLAESGRRGRVIAPPPHQPPYRAGTLPNAEP